MFTFEAPLYLTLALLAFPGIYLRHFWRKRASLVPFAFDVWKGRGFSPSSGALRCALVFSHAAFWAGFLFLVMALAGPGFTVRERVFLTRGVDMMFVIDASPSMAARDFPPENRFEAARETVRRFVRGRENDPLGLVVFGYEAALRVPPTLDYAFFLEELDRLRIMDMGDGTAIGMGLAVAALHLQASSAGEKVIILLTDGKNNAGEISPGTAARLAAGMGIRIYTIGIGGGGEAPIEFTDPATGKIFRGSLEGGFDEEVIRSVAEESGGSYFSAGNPGTLGAVFGAIDSLETVEKRARIQVKTEAGHIPFILVGLALLVLDFFIRFRFLREVV
ncbi:MAG: VWA domain-containing protein [Spirochaetales bacterium]|jgi:Ca-activated chloride channel family protein|nr:VWA domain-containing protein [Spirochaetales bacterium]